MENLVSFGFKERDGRYVYHTNLVDGQMQLTVTLDIEGTATTKVLDTSAEEEYVLHQIDGAAGSFVGRVKGEYEAALEAISEKCFDWDVFKSRQTQAVIAHIQNTYRNELEYLWKKFPDNAIVRRKDNQKWYALLLTVSRRKLGFNSDDTVEILDLRMTPEDIQHTVDGVTILPGYHMNKKHWITICLDDSVSLDKINSFLDKSYALAKK